MAMTRKLFCISSLLFCALPIAAQTPQQPFNAPGRYEIESVASGQVLDVSTSDNSEVQQYTRTDRENQQWDIQPAGGGYFYIRSVGTGKVLSLADGSGRKGTHVIVYQQHGGQDQLWQIVSVAPAQFKIISKYGRMLDLPNGSDERGTHLQIWDPRDNKNQLFRLVLVSAASPSAYQGMNPSAPWAPQPPRQASPNWRREQAARACRTEVSHHIADVPLSEIAVDPVSRSAQGNLIVMWRTPRGSSGFCEVDPSEQIVEFKVEQMSR
jgi:hypothetical protein